MFGRRRGRAGGGYGIRDKDEENEENEGTWLTGGPHTDIRGQRALSYLPESSPKLGEEMRVLRLSTDR
jgi:hypothetical protein